MKFRNLHILLLTCLSLAATCIVSCRQLESTGAANSGEKLSYEKQQAFNELYRAALRHQMADRPDAAYEVLARALQINPDAPEALVEMALYNYGAQSLFDSTKTQMGDSLLSRAIELAPETMEYKEMLANILVARHEYKRALPICEMLAQTKPYSAEKNARLIGLYEATGDYEKAIRTIEELEKMEGYDEELSSDKLRNYIRLQDSARAYSLLDDLRRNHPKDARYDAMLADVYIHYGDTARAGAFLKSVKAEETENPYLQISLAHYRKLQGQDELTTQTLRKVAVNPHASEDLRLETLQQLFSEAKTRADSVSLFPLIRQSLEAPVETSLLGRFGAYIGSSLDYPTDSIDVMLQSIVEKEPTFVVAWNRLAISKFLGGDVPEALRICHDGQAKNPEDPYLYLTEARIHASVDDPAAALEALRRGERYAEKDEDEEEQASYLFFYAEMLHIAGDDAEAFRKFELAIEKDSSDMTSLNNYAYYLSLRGENLERAEQLSRRTIEAEPESSTFLDTYAWILFRLGRFDEAREYIDKVLNDDSGELDAAILDHAGDIYLRCGNISKARLYWKLALKMSPDADMEKSLRKKLNSKKR